MVIEVYLNSTTTTVHKRTSNTIIFFHFFLANLSSFSTSKIFKLLDFNIINATRLCKSCVHL